MAFAVIVFIFYYSDAVIIFFSPVDPRVKFMLSHTTLILSPPPCHRVHQDGVWLCAGAVSGTSDGPSKGGCEVRTQ